VKKAWTILTVYVLLAGCSSVNVNEGNSILETDQQHNTSKTVSISENQGKDLVNAYGLALDTLLSLDHGWDNDIKYISVELNSAQGLTDTNIPVIVENLKKHKVAVLQLPLDELVKQGLADQRGVLDGILLQIQEATLTDDNKLTVSGKAIKSAKQSIGTTIELQKKNNVWEVSNTTITTES